MSLAFRLILNFSGTRLPQKLSGHSCDITLFIHCQTVPLPPNKNRFLRYLRNLRATTMKYINEIEKRKTFAIISHPDAGKTTLTEKFLLFGGAIQTAGAVKSTARVVKSTARVAKSVTLLIG